MLDIPGEVGGIEQAILHYANSQGGGEEKRFIMHGGKMNYKASSMYMTRMVM